VGFVRSRLVHAFGSRGVSVVNSLAKGDRKIPLFCVPSMFDSLEVKVLFTRDGREVIAKRKGGAADKPESLATCKSSCRQLPDSDG
jgi:hypothetical protein